MAIEIVFFDMGGVILRQPVEFVHREIERRLEIPEGALRWVSETDVRSRLNTGDLSVIDVAHRVKTEHALRCNVLEVWRRAYLDVMTVNRTVLELAEALSSMTQVGLITNVPDSHFEWNKERGVYEHFSPVIVSCLCHVEKPAKEIFEFALSAARVDAAASVFIDDRRGHLKTPRDLGFHTIHFRGLASVLQGLSALNIGDHRFDEWMSCRAWGEDTESGEPMFRHGST